MVGRRRRTQFAGFVVCMGEERLLERVVFGAMLGEKGFSYSLRRIVRRPASSNNGSARRTEDLQITPTGYRWGAGRQAEMTHGLGVYGDHARATKDGWYRAVAAMNERGGGWAVCPTPGCGNHHQAPHPSRPR